MARRLWVLVLGALFLFALASPRPVPELGRVVAIMLLDEAGEVVWTPAMSDWPAAEKLKAARKVVGFDLAGRKVLERPLLFLAGEPVVDMGWGYLKLKTLLEEAKANARYARYREQRYRYPYDDDGYEYRYRYDDDWYEHRYPYDDDWYEYRRPYYDDDWYEYRYRHR